ncbi:alcohol dehydrogenase [Aspergillus bombycis]|uniref:Alcohol dehydrogenase n=1 Tax=Aspergillus bombycis TaxID=109264 RepID=A0A1F7ZV94_9EURO|nr:alcohol dehydrogenase [Aspergillus bombycis]OGM43179.1 alcohol dehydrogenase [Aspergillus bombycis]
MEVVLNRAEARIKKVLGKIKDNALHEEVDTVFSIARTESRMAIQSQKKQLPHVPVTSLNPQDVSNIFGINEGGEYNPWKFTQDELRAVPDNLSKLALVPEFLTSSGTNTMLHHARKEVQQNDVSIYGIATDSFTWTFLYLDNSGKWASGQENLIYYTTPNPAYPTPTTMTAIPETQTAAVLPPSGATADALLQIKTDHPVPSPGEGEILVKIEYSGVCHSDVHSIRGETPMLTDVAGHEGVGKVVMVGSGIDEQEWIGRRVGIRWLYSSCLNCEICAVNNTACPYQKNAGANVPGTFQQYIVSPAIHVTKIPSEIAPDVAAPLLCAGIAMYSSIMKTRTRPGDWIVLPGAGGGLGHMGVQIAARKGLKVIAIDSGEKKKELCLALGATAFFDYKVDDIEKEVKSLTGGLGAHAVICTANSEPAYTQRLTIVGNSAGTAKEMDELMAMAVAGDVRAHIECFELDQINDVVMRLGRSEIDGRAVVKIPE